MTPDEKLGMKADVVALELRPVHEALGKALKRLAGGGITGRTYFNAKEGLLIVWLDMEAENQ